jgi:hypothetical protein
MTTETSSNVWQFYQPHQMQQDVHGAKFKEKYLEWARRGGKSRGLLGELLLVYRQSFSRTRETITKHQLVPRGFHAWIVAPANPQGRQIWAEMKELIPKEFIIGSPSESDWTIELVGPDPDITGFIELKSAFDADSLQTVGVDFLGITESQDVSDKAIQKLRPILRSPGRMGRALFEGIPSLYSDHWFRRGCVAAKAHRLKSAAYFHATFYDNPMLSAEVVEEIESDKEVMPETAWRRMYLAEFSRNAGYFRNIDECIAGDLMTDPIPGGYYIAGLDIGISNDATVMVVMDGSSRAVVDHYSFNSMTWPDQKGRIQRIADHWGLEAICPDASSLGKGLVQDLVEMGLPIVPNDGQGNAGVAFVGSRRGEYLSRLAVALERGTIQFPAIPSLLRQLRMFQHVVTSTGMVRVQAPSGEHDDEVFALALAISVCHAPTAATMQERRVSLRVLPTQQEANGGGLSSSIGAMMMKKRRSDRMKQRMDKAGVV